MVRTQRLDPEAPDGVAEHVHQEQLTSTQDLPTVEPDDEPGQRQVPHRLVEERGVEGLIGLETGRAVLGIDLQAPRQRCRTAEHLLVEPVAQPSDRLGNRDGRGHDVEQVSHRPSVAPNHPPPHQNPGGDPPGNAQAALGDLQRPDPVVAVQLPVGGDVIQPRPDHPRRYRPDGDGADVVGIAAPRRPAPRRDRHRGHHPQGDAQPVDVQRDRSDLPHVHRRARDRRQLDAAQLHQEIRHAHRASTSPPARVPTLDGSAL